MVRPKDLLVLILLFGLPGCGGDLTPTSASSSQCSTQGQVTFVRDTLRDIYFWYKEIPNPDPATFSSPEAYLEAVRYRPLDTTFSYVADKAASEAFFSESQFIGLGIGTKATSATELRISQVFPGSPASDAGLARGDYVLTINGKAVPDLLRTGEIDTIFGASQVGVVVSLTWRTLAGDSRSASFTKRLVTIPTVAATRVYNVCGGPRVGYVFFRNFVSPSVAALNTAFHELRDAGATELVLDLATTGEGS